MFPQKKEQKRQEEPMSDKHSSKWRKRVRERERKDREASEGRTDFLLAGTSRRAKKPNSAITITQDHTCGYGRRVFRTVFTKCLSLHVVVSAGDTINAWSTACPPP